jgi:hypothetical protein
LLSIAEEFYLIDALGAGMHPHLGDLLRKLLLAEERMAQVLLTAKLFTEGLALVHLQLDCGHSLRAAFPIIVSKYFELPNGLKGGRLPLKFGSLQASGHEVVRLGFKQGFVG